MDLKGLKAGCRGSVLVVGATGVEAANGVRATLEGSPCVSGCIDPKRACTSGSSKICRL